MAEKISTLILKVDLDCHLCCKKIRKTLCKIQEKQEIKTISYDDKNNTVTISGPFNAKKLAGKLTCKAGKVIKDIQIKENKEKEKEKPKDTKPATKPTEPEKEKPKPSKPEKETKPAEPAAAKPKPTEKPKADAPKEKAAEQPKAEAKKTEPTIAIQSPMGWPAGPVCCYRPSYEGYYGGYRCCSCGRVNGWIGGAPQSVYGGAPCGEFNRNCQYFSEEDPSGCSIM